MKRRADEVQFGARTPQRILTTQHSTAREYTKKNHSNRNAKLHVSYSHVIRFQLDPIFSIILVPVF